MRASSYLYKVNHDSENLRIFASKIVGIWRLKQKNQKLIPKEALTLKRTHEAELQ